ncbi:dihydrofolate reductase family protein [Dictyobacter formicarum]|uniref:Pyrimidine reductase n=1 Tax=Dictyobacter formicarum TaxID=2778368 RepID=A0ABQ3VSH1_9CHLR|nr:dihydrofolate reductase family protein [Dictyobacter formicarum]GHO88066.1 pyrimidine reductase [Dictyobacter formicarum]
MKLRVSEIVSLDGVMEAPDHWVFPYMDQEIGEYVMSVLQETDAMLFGRKTYQEMAAAWPERSGAMADIFNGVPKYVVSTTLSELAWNNSRLIPGNIVEEVARLKAQPGRVMLINGSAELVQLLTQHHLIDEYILTVAPLVLLKGKRLFQVGMEGQLHLLDSKAYKTGIVRLNYQPVKQ